MTGEEYEFQIDAFSPATIPMARLAQYLAELAALLGQPERVHFEKLKKGSVRLVARVEHEAIPKVRMRSRRQATLRLPRTCADHTRKLMTCFGAITRSGSCVGQLQRDSFPGSGCQTESTHGPVYRARRNRRQNCPRGWY